MTINIEGRHFQIDQWDGPFLQQSSLLSVTDMALLLKCFRTSDTYVTTPPGALRDKLDRICSALKQVQS